MKRLAWILVVVALLVPAGAGGQSALCPGVSRALVAYDFETITVSTVAIGFTTSKLTSGPLAVAVTIESQSLRYRDDGSSPTASVGHRADAGSGLWVCGGSVGRFLMIRKDGADSTVRATFYRAS
jgi:hypothetical protein